MNATRDSLLTTDHSDANATVLHVSHERDGYNVRVHVDGGKITTLYAGHDAWYGSLAVNDRISVN